jgi:hypothetical protein
MTRRASALVAAVSVVAALGLAACGSKDNGGVIDNPTVTSAPGATSVTSAPGATSTTAGGGTPGY